MRDRQQIWDDSRMALADVVSRRSPCSQNRVGAVVTDSLDRVVSTGYNRPPEGFAHYGQSCKVWCARGGAGVLDTIDIRKLDYADCPSLHAEANALLHANPREREGGTLYVTSDVCFACAKLIAASGVSRLVHTPTPVSEPRDPTGYVFLRRCGIDIIHWTHKENVDDVL